MYKRKWRPNAAQKREYAERMSEQESIKFIASNGAIRMGCFVRWIDKSTSNKYSGTVVNSSYGKETNQHTFTIKLESGKKKLVKGRNLYDRLLGHIQGESSIKESY